MVPTRRTGSSAARLAIVGLLVACACGGSDGGDAQFDTFAALARAGEPRSIMRYYDSVEEAMPNVAWTIDGNRHRESQLYVRGTVAGVRPGRSFTFDSEGTPTGIGEFDAEGADRWEVLVDVDVTQSIAAPGHIGDETVAIMIRFDTEVRLDAIRADLVGVEVAALLSPWDSARQRPSSDYELLEDTFLGRVVGAVVEFPAAEEGLAPADLTFADLESPEDQATVVLETGPNGELVRRR